MTSPDFAGFRDVHDPSPHPGRSWWELNAEDYLADHGEFLGRDDFCWCPEGLREADARLLGDVRGRHVLEVGAGAAQCSRWLRAAGAHPVASDVAWRMLTAFDGDGDGVARVQADARALPFAADSFDTAFTAFGAIPFVPDAARVHQEVARVLRPGGTWVFAVTHPIRWAMPDDPEGLEITRSYFDRRPYVELGADGGVEYAEYHRTLGDHVADVVGAGLLLERVVEPEWPAGHTRAWGGWGPARGARVPGTAIFVCRLPDR
ncbi:class I SAM-dependent methyltransferase [Cellulomonas bogoriensis]|uniref:SAM-dependent methyltransferase n=1 Tax=Cellulomonas bogoriensis 69B4 = DSM 16987 TaxID=1386082 RepID=A0A0A0C1D4_9CELL|nr:class I SAM-dependent methyltransferase [Cellulomonas bogoriensis]KGM14468.1 SAM-dependent methyltransferase [Cellulomonas bogoriensis 69B4 = DSM 16987]